MSRAPTLESVAIISCETGSFSTPSHSPAAEEPSSFPALGTSTSERDPLLPVRRKKPFYRARPLWIAPFAITAALVRGMTLAPRVEVFTSLACEAQLHHQDGLSFNPSIPNSVNHSYVGTIALRMPDNGHNDDDDDDDDPRHLPSSRCLTDANVQAGAARLQTIMTTTMGFFSALTSGWWGARGQQRGRTWTLAIATLGLLLTDVTFILVSTPGLPFSRHGHKLLILSPIIEGSLGGWSALHSATMAYISDCTSPGSRATIFSRFAGVFYTGFSLGPVLGGYIIRSGLGSQPNQPKSVTAVFWIAAFCSLLNLLMVVFVFPESLSKEKRAAVAQQYRREHSKKGKGRAILRSSSRNLGLVPVNETSVGAVYNFFSPLALFVPTVITDDKGRKWNDWSLTFLGIGLFSYFLATGVYQIKYLYAVHTFNWNTEQLSFYISLMGGTRAIFLLLILPLVIATFKPKPKIDGPQVQGQTIKSKATKPQLAREIRFDMLLARISLFIDFLSNTLITLVPAPTYKVHQAVLSTDGIRNQVLFVLASSLSGIGSAVVPAVQSLALCVVQARALVLGNANAVSDAEFGTGKVLGALAVIQAVGQMIAGPLLFGLIYSETVARHPKAVFVTAAGILIVALGSLFLSASPLPKRHTREWKGKKASKQTDMDVERGRSRVSKDLFGYGAQGNR